MICHLKTSDRKHEIASILYIPSLVFAALCREYNLDLSDNRILSALRGMARFTAPIME